MIRLAEILLERPPHPFWTVLRQLGIEDAVGVLPRYFSDWRESAGDQLIAAIAQRDRPTLGCDEAAPESCLLSDDIGALLDEPDELREMLREGDRMVHDSLGT